MPSRASCPIVPLLLTAAMCAVPSGAAAQGAPSAAVPAPATAPAVAPPVEALVAEALARSPALAARRSDVAAREAEEGPAAALPDPMVEAMLQNPGLEWRVGEEDMAMLGGELRQQLPYPGKRRAARRVAEAATARARAALVHQERQLAHDVRVVYAKIYAVDGELEALAAARELVELLEATTRGRYTVGESDAASLLRAGLERTRLGEEEADLLAERAVAVAELGRLLDWPGGVPLGPVRELPAMALAEGSIEELALHGSAEVALRAADSDRTAAELARRRLDLEPDFSAGAGVGWRDDLDPMITLRLGVSLPLWKRGKQQALVTAAEHDLAARRHEEADARAMARAEAAALLARFRTAEEQARRYRDGVLPQSAAVLDAARAAYLAGRGGFAELLEAFSTWLQARAGLVRRESDRFAAWAGLEHLAGGHLAQGDLPGDAQGDLP